MRLALGQGVVVSRGTVLAVEAFEGTNAMLMMGQLVRSVASGEARKTETGHPV